MGEVVLLALGLALDCTAVAAATGVAVARVRLRDALKMATIFGTMQALLGSLGWIGGVGVTRFIAAWDHWVAFGLLVLIGGKMVVEGLREEPEDEDVEEEAASFRLSRLLLLGLATSIDSAAVGITLPLLEFPIGLAIAIIGAASFVLTIVALYLADRVAGRFSERL
ncbi:MAG TPA: manganese efflux pump, partial [Longimicrobiales bacterium]|nr:manganese efflux pump [Longimicrobiales bacterium]